MKSKIDAVCADVVYKLGPIKASARIMQVINNNKSALLTILPSSLSPVGQHLLYGTITTYRTHA